MANAKYNKSFRTKGGKKCWSLLQKYAAHHELGKPGGKHHEGRVPKKVSFWTDYYVGMLFDGGRWTAARYPSIEEIVGESASQEIFSNSNQYHLEQILKAAVDLGLCTERDRDAFLGELHRMSRESWDKAAMESARSTAEKHGYKLVKV